MLTHLNISPSLPSRVVVLGSQGFVGSHIVRKLQAEGVPVLSIPKKEVDLLELSATEKLLKYLKPEDALVIVSAQAPCKNDEMLLNNLKMMAAINAALLQRPVAHLVYISSDAVYGEGASLISESSAVSPNCYHSMMHAAREFMLKSTQKNASPVAILRPSLLYGLEDPHNGYGPNRFRRLALEGKTITLFGEGEEKRDHVFIEDVAALAYLSLLHRSQGILNIVTGVSLSFRETAEIIVEQVGQSIPIQGTPRQNPITHRHFNNIASQKAFSEFSYTPFQVGIMKVISKAKAALALGEPA